MFSYQGSCRSFQATALIFYQISFRLSRTFFFFSPVLSALFRSASSDSLYRLSHLQGAVNNFFQVIFDVLSRPFPGQIFPSFQRFRLFSPALLLPGRSASASPAELIPGSFKFPSSATGAILSLLEGIVNVFLVFYLFQTIHTIQYFLTILKVQNMALPIIVFIHTLNACRTEKNTAGSSPKRSICYNRN